MVYKVFVYGTLLEGEGNHRLLSGSEKVVDEAYVKGTLVHLGGFPGAISVNHGDRFILGEVYKVNDETLQRLDRLEGYDAKRDRSSNLYNRVTVPVYASPMDDEPKEDVFIYEFNSVTGRTYRTIQSGNWREG